MNGALLQNKIYAGYGKAANVIGTPHVQYRATTPFTPIAAQNILSTMPAAFDIGGSFANQSKADQIIWQAILNGSSVAIGDYLVGDNTWCIIGMQSLMPVMAMRCTDTISVSRGTATLNQGADGSYRAIQSVGANIPCYIQLKRDKGFSAPVGFLDKTNSDAPMPEWIVYVGLGGITPIGFFQEGDVVTDSARHQWKIDAASISTVMWQLACTPYIPDA